MAKQVVIEGLGRLNAKLRDLESGIQKAYAREVVVPTGFDLERNCKREAPVDKGALRAEIHFEMTSDTSGEVRSGDTLDYPVHVHNGHRTRSGSTVAANPYMKRGANQTQKDYARRTTQFAKKLERDAAE